MLPYYTRCIMMKSTCCIISELLLGISIIFSNFEGYALLHIATHCSRCNQIAGFIGYKGQCTTLQFSTGPKFFFWKKNSTSRWTWLMQSGQLGFWLEAAARSSIICAAVCYYCILDGAAKMASASKQGPIKTGKMLGFLRLLSNVKK